MKPVAEKQRQALIERLKKIASWAETYGPDHNVMLPASEAKEMAEAYIASLTAEPEYWQFMSVNGNWIGIGKQGMEQAVSEGCEVRPLYTAPPVPVLQFPDEYDSVEINNLLNEKYGIDTPVDALGNGVADEVWSACISETKRLNGMVE